jgi:hypothetical protein
MTSAVSISLLVVAAVAATRAQSAVPPPWAYPSRLP